VAGGVDGGALEGVQVHDDEVEGMDLVLLERGEIVVAVPSREDPGVHAGMERLDPPAEHLRNLDHGGLEAELVEEIVSGSAGRHELDPELCEAARKGVEPGLVIG